MKTRSEKSAPIAPPQYFDTEPISDPAELAALEKKLKNRNTARTLSIRNGRKIQRKSVVAKIIQLARRLSMEEQSKLLKELAAQIVSGKQRKLARRVS